MPEYIATTDPLTGEDPSLAWMRREHPERFAARTTPHAFVHYTRDPEFDKCPPEGSPGCICDTCWERKSLRVHR